MRHLLSRLNHGRVDNYLINNTWDDLFPLQTIPNVKIFSARGTTSLQLDPNPTKRGHSVVLFLEETDVTCFALRPTSLQQDSDLVKSCLRTPRRPELTLCTFLGGDRCDFSISVGHHEFSIAFIDPP
jgi:hypothetical protein